MQHQAKHEMKQRIENSVPREELTALSFTAAEYKNIDWFEENEFRLNGDMYDVVRKATDDKGNIVVYVINDKKEKELFIDLEEQTNQYDQNSATEEEDTQKTLELFSNPLIEFNYLIHEKSILPSLAYQSSLLSFVREILPPPPKLA